jgi:DNA-binding NarL/FixJ family response regulator
MHPFVTDVLQRRAQWICPGVGAMTHSNRRIRVVVADDSPTALAAMCRYLESEAIFEVIGTARDGEQLIAEAQRKSPDLVLSDLSMPRMTGLEAATVLRKASPGLRILIVTQLNGLSLRDECLRSGADGLVEKSQMPEKLLEEVSRLFPSL